MLRLHRCLSLVHVSATSHPPCNLRVESVMAMMWRMGMRMRMRTGVRRIAAAVASVVVCATGFWGVSPAMAADQSAVYPSDANKPAVESLLGEFKQYWSAKDNPSNDPSDVFRGLVTDKGVAILGRNDDLVVSINNKAAADNAAGTLVDGTYTQVQRAHRCRPEQPRNVR